TDGDRSRGREGLASVETSSAVAPPRAEFRGVSFAYQGDHRVIENVSFSIEPGETVAVVGHTGAGKTTLTSLLLRFYDVQEGGVLLDGVDIRRLRLRDLRRNFGMVLQDPFLFSGTVASNIRLGTAWITDEQMREAARQLLQALPPPVQGPGIAGRPPPPARRELRAAGRGPSGTLARPWAATNRRFSAASVPPKLQH